MATSRPRDEVAVVQTLRPEIVLDSGGPRVCILRIDLYLLPSPARRGHFLDSEAACWTGRAEVPASARPNPFHLRVLSSVSDPPPAPGSLSRDHPGEQVPVGQCEAHQRA